MHAHCEACCMHKQTTKSYIDDTRHGTYSHILILHLNLAVALVQMITTTKRTRTKAIKEWRPSWRVASVVLTSSLSAIFHKHFTATLTCAFPTAHNLWHEKEPRHTLLRRG